MADPNAHASVPAGEIRVCGKRRRFGQAVDSIIASGSIISGATVLNSVLSHNVFVHSYSLVEDSVLFSDVAIERHARIKNAVIDKNCVIDEGVEIGYNPEFDKAHFTVTPGGITIVPKWTRVTSDGVVTSLKGPYSPIEEEIPNASNI